MNDKTRTRKKSDLYYQVLRIEGLADQCSCDWEYVDQKRWDIVKRMIQYVGMPFEIYRVLTKRENGYGDLAIENKTVHFEIIEKTKIASLKELTGE